MAIIGQVNPESVVNYGVQRWDDLKTARTGKEAIWGDCVDMYMSKFSPKLAKWLEKHHKSSRYIGLPWDAVETVYSQVMGQLFPGDQWLKFRASEPGGIQVDDKAAVGMQRLCYQQHRQSGFYRDFGNGVVKQLIILGSAPFTSGWDVEWTVDYPSYAKSMTEWEMQNAMAWQAHQQEAMAWQMQARQLAAAGIDISSLPGFKDFEVPQPPAPQQKIAYQGPVLECDDLFNFVIDPYPNRKRTALRIKRSFKSLAYLRRFAEPDEMGYAVYQNLGDISEVDLQSSRTSTDSQIAARAASFGLNTPKLNRGVELLELQGDMEIPVDGSGSIQVFVNYTATIANSKTLIRFEPGFLWTNEPSTYLATICNPPGETYGIGILEPNRGTNEVLQARTNQLVDGVAAAINPEYKCIEDGIVDVNATSAPGKRHLVGRMDNMEPIKKDLGGIYAAMQDYASLKAEFQQGTRSINPSVPMYQRSATEVNQNAGVIAATLNQIVRDIEEGGLSAAIRHQVCMNGMFINNTVMAHTIENGVDSWMPISPLDIRRGWIIDVRGSQHVAERTQKVQDLMFFGQMTGGNPVYAPFVRHLQYLKKVYAEMGFHDAEDLFVDEKTGTAILLELMVNGTLAGTGAKSGASSGGGSNAASSGAGGGGAEVQDDTGDGSGDAGIVRGPWVSDDPAIPGDGSRTALPGLRA
ncbi:MAG: hypothetical protein IPO08_20025 [Xanthomonadales bacterium]|nr:hypothetical protein [Xanthomonadales bacterium]